MKQFNLPRTILIARIVFLFVLVGGLVLVAARGNFISRASNKPANTTRPGEGVGKSRSSSSYASDLKASTLSPPCTTNPVVVNNSDSGAGSLRQAIVDACPSSTITFNMAMVTTPITLISAELSINKNLTITGPGANLLTVQRSTAGGTPNFRVFNISSGTVSISGVTVTNGKPADGTAANSGTSGGDGGGIMNAGTLALSNVTLSGNTGGSGGTGVSFGGRGGHGGGIYNSGALTMTSCIISGNNGGRGGDATSVPGDGGSGGGVYNSQSLTMTDCQVTANNGGGGGDGGASFGGNGGSGGGISINSSTGTGALTNLVITNNHAGDTGSHGGGGNGGGIDIEPLTIVTLTNSTVSGNQSGTSAQGGAGFAGGILNQGVLTLTGSTISNNTTLYVGGGILNRTIGAIKITNSTISGNQAPDGGGMYDDNSSGSSLTNCTITNNSPNGITASVSQPEVRNTIIAGNGVVADVKSTLSSQGNNLIGKSNGTNGFTNGTNGDRVGSLASPLDPRLGPLANNGGPTQTHALLADSTAIDAGNNCVLTNSCSPSVGFALTTDQRGVGFNRAVDGNGDGSATVDIGAYEGESLLVTNTGDSGPGSLRQAIMDANVNLHPSTINFKAGLTGTIALLTVLPAISTSLSINGPGANKVVVQRSTAGGTLNFRIFTINNGNTVSISGLTISNGRASGDGGGILNGVSTLNLINCTVSSNSANHGGGIENNFGTLNVTNSTFMGNSAVNNGGGIDSHNTQNIVNSTFSGNSANGGGAVMSDGVATVTNSTFTGNTAIGNGGGIANQPNAQVGIRNSILALNTTVTICGGNCPNGSPDLFGDFTSQGRNLIGKSDGSTGFTNGINGDQVGSVATPLDPHLGPLGNNGGPTQTRALLAGSPAIDAGDNAAVTNPPFNGPPFTDQRGGSFNRIADGDGNSTAVVDIGAYELQGILTVDKVTPPAGRVTGGQQIVLAGAFANLSTVTMGGATASWIYTNGAGDTSMITVTTPAHAVGAVQIDLTPTSGSPYSKANAFAYLPTVFTDDTIMAGVTTAKAQHIIELRQAVDAMRAVAGLGGAPWTDPALAPGDTIKAMHILDLRTFLDDAATRLGYSTSPYTDPSLTAGYLIKRVHVEELRQRIRVIAG